MKGHVALLVAMLVAGTQPLQAQTSDAEWSDYALIQFIAVAGGSPHSILRLDDNGSLVLRARSGVSTSSLREAGARESQVRLLEAWRLLEQDDGNVRAAFPILDARQTNALRRLTRAAAPGVADAIEEDARRLRAELDATGRGDNTYSILFSYVLDGLTWDLWERSGDIRPRAVTAERPFWAGEVWALTPERPMIVGTNRVSDDRGMLGITWSYEALGHLGPFVTDLVAVEDLFEALVDGERVASQGVADTFAPYRVLDDRGEPTIPVIVLGSDDPVYALCRSMALTLTHRVATAVDLPGLVERFGFRDESQALVIAYHELMWDTLQELEERGVVARPPVLDGDADSPADVASLLYLVRPGTLTARDR